MIRVFLLRLGLAGSAFAVEPGAMLHDPGLEERARDLSKGLRCLLCPNGVRRKPAQNKHVLVPELVPDMQVDAAVACMYVP